MTLGPNLLVGLGAWARAWVWVRRLHVAPAAGLCEGGRGKGVHVQLSRHLGARKMLIQIVVFARLRPIPVFEPTHKVQQDLLLWLFCCSARP